MGKVKNKPRHAENEAFAKARHVRGSERKLNLVAGMIRGKAAQRALIDLEFSTRRMANEVKKVLESAIANAENNHGLDVDRLYVKEAYVGRTLTMKRFHARGRGRAAGIEKPFSNITIIVRELGEGETLKPKKVAKKKVAETTEKPAKKTAEKKAPAKKTATKTAAKKAE